MKSVSKNYLYNMAYQIMLIIIPLITTPYISRVLGVDKIGIYNYTYTVAYYFITIAQLGLNLYGRKEVSIVRENREKAAQLFKQLFLIRVASFLIAIIVFIGLIIAADKYKVYYLLLVPYLISSMIDITWFFQAFEEFKIITIRNFIVKIIVTVCIFVFVRHKDDLWIYMLIYSTSELFSQAAMWFNMKKRIEKTGFSTLGIRQHIRGSMIMFLPQIITTLYTLVDKLVLGLFTTETQVGYYSQSERIVKLTLTIVSSMGVVMMPRIANIASHGDIKEIDRMLSKSRRFICFMAFPMIAGLLGISDNFTDWFFGAGYEPVSYLMCIISPIILFIGLSDLYGMQYLIPNGHIKEYTLSAAGGAAVNVVLNIVLVHKYQAVGVSLATVVAELVVAVLMWKFSKKYIKLSEKVSLVYAFAAVVIGFIVKILDTVLPCSILTTIAEMSVGVLIYITILYVVKDKLLMEILYRFKILKK